MFDKKPDPCIFLTEINFDFNFLHIPYLAETLGLLFLVNLPITLISAVFFYKTSKISLYINKLY